MSDYQAVYDAVRSRVYWPDVENILRDKFDISWQMQAIQQEFMIVAHEMQRPCVLFKPKLYPDGNMWCALYGEDLQQGIAGFGETPEKAMRDFDNNYHSSKTLEAA